MKLDIATLIFYSTLVFLQFLLFIVITSQNPPSKMHEVIENVAQSNVKTTNYTKLRVSQFSTDPQYFCVPPKFVKHPCPPLCCHYSTPELTGAEFDNCDPGCTAFSQVLRKAWLLSWIQTLNEQIVNKSLLV